MINFIVAAIIFRIESELCSYITFIIIINLWNHNLNSYQWLWMGKAEQSKRFYDNKYILFHN